MLRGKPWALGLVLLCGVASSAYGQDLVRGPEVPGAVGVTLRLPTGITEDLSLTAGALLQVDHRLYGESQRADNRFDIRRAQLSLDGEVPTLFQYRFSYEFQGGESRHLLDGYGEFGTAPWARARVGQGKVPFGFEWQTADRALPFVERTTAADLGPGRDVGALAHGALGGELLWYSLGVFNGDGRDGAGRGSQEDAPEFAGRAVLAPLALLDGRAGDLRFGASGTAARIDLANVNLEVKAVGMVGTNRSLYVLNPNSKFGVLQEVKNRYRIGLESAWAAGPAVLFGEYVHLRYTGLKPAGRPAQDADFSSWYVAGRWALGADQASLQGAVLQPVRPRTPWGTGGWGALVLGARYSRFDGDEDWILEDANVSVRHATAATVSLGWVLRRELQLTFDYTYTAFSDPLLVRRNPDGSIDYLDRERVLTTRFQLAF